MSINGILSSALTALQTNSAALRVVSNNVANLNTEGYARRVVHQQALVTGNQISGVEIADIQRMADKFLVQEQLSATAASSRFNIQSRIYDQLSGILGEPGDGRALTTQLDNIYKALGNAALAPSSSASQQGILTAFRSFSNTVSSLSTSITALQKQVDQQLETSVGAVNGLVKQLYTLNQQIQSATARGDTSSGLLDQRDMAIKSLSSLIDLRVSQQTNGGVTIMTADGMNLVGDSYAQLSYRAGESNGSYGRISIQNHNPATGEAIGAAQPLDPHLTSGSLKGLIEMRDSTLSDLSLELGNLAQNTARAFNQQSNANTSVPPPLFMEGRSTGLLATDQLNFTGKSTLAVADANGNLVSRIDIDFGSGSLLVDGATTINFSDTVGDFVGALNSALGSNGTAQFSGGVLKLSATGSNGLILQDDAANPAGRGGAGLSNFFGLNDIFRAGVPTQQNTGLSSSDTGGFNAGGVMSFMLKDQNGNVARQATVTLTAGMSIGDIITAMNTSLGGAATASLDAQGKLTVSPAPQYANYRLDVTNDTTQRGDTGMGFTTLFGLGGTALAATASSFGVNQALLDAPSKLPFAQSNITASTVIGDTIAGSGDNRGLLALQNVQSTDQLFAKIGNLGARSASLGDYAAAFYQDVATRAQGVEANATAQSDRLIEAEARALSVSGVNLDEELTNMMTYQQAYAAGARMLQVVQQLYDTLLDIR